MLFPDSDSVKFQKANAMAKFDRFRKMAKLMQMLEVVVVLTLLSWSLSRLPAFMKFSGQNILKLSIRFFNPHVVFLIGNVIIVALFVLSRQSTGSIVSTETVESRDEDTKKDSTCQTADIVQHTVEVPASNTVVHQTPNTQAPTNEDTVDKQIVRVENVVPRTQCDAVATAIEEATKQIQKFQRTQSEKLKREINMKPLQRELRRSETEKRRITMVSTGEREAATTYESVDNLSNEEFQLTVDAFIEKHQKFFHAQKLAEQSKQQANKDLVLVS